MKEELKKRGVCDLFLGGRSNVQRLLTEAIRNGVETSGIKPEELDARCRLGVGDLPRYAWFEQNPSLITKKAFCRIAWALGISIDQVLKPDLSKPKNLQRAIENMKANGARLLAACGEKDVAGVMPEEIAPVYVMAKALEEI